jgi:hypothetical protein
MTGSEIVTAFVAIVGALVGAGAYFNSRRETRNRRAEAAATEAATTARIANERREAQFNADLKLQDFIEKQVDARVADRLDEFRTEINDLRAKDLSRTQAITRILRTIANQWPGVQGPDLDPDDIRAVEETIPPQWIRKRPSPTT